MQMNHHLDPACHYQLVTPADTRIVRLGACEDCGTPTLLLDSDLSEVEGAPLDTHVLDLIAVLPEAPALYRAQLWAKLDASLGAGESREDRRIGAITPETPHLSPLIAAHLRELRAEIPFYLVGKREITEKDRTALARSQATPELSEAAGTLESLVRDLLEGRVQATVLDATLDLETGEVEITSERRFPDNLN